MDLARGRIYNWLTFPVLCAGLVASGIWGGWSVFVGALLAVVAALLLYGWMFLLGHMGAGDVKLLMALAAWGGLKFAVYTAILGVLLGGVMAAVILIVTGRMPDFLRRLYRFLVCLLVKELEFEAPRVDRKLTMPYGVPIAAAAIWVLLW
jgi:prepilin peptidase CpaA